MEKFIKTLLLVFLFSSLIFSQEQRFVLVELFTNSFCPLCPPAHSALDSYNANSPNADEINYIFYHMVYPSSTDPLYQYNESDSDGRNVFYNSPNATPTAFFDGIKQEDSYSSWASTLNTLVTEESPFKITLTGSLSDSINMHINAEVLRNGDVADNDLVINFILVENTNYQGGNGVLNNRNVMRKMVTSPAGESFTINMGETKNVAKDITIGNGIIPENSSVVVFIQSSSAKTVYQSAHISYSDLTLVTGVKPVNETPSKYSLSQNYPNPFNPSTKIKYYLPEEALVKLKVYNVLGKEISSLVNKDQMAGSYEYTFNAGDLSSGIYFYRLTAVNHTGKETVQTKKMTLIK